MNNYWMTNNAMQLTGSVRHVGCLQTSRSSRSQRAALRL